MSENIFQNSANHKPPINHSQALMIAGQIGGPMVRTLNKCAPSCSDECKSAIAEIRSLGRQVVHDELNIKIETGIELC